MGKLDGLVGVERDSLEPRLAIERPPPSLSALAAREACVAELFGGPRQPVTLSRYVLLDQVGAGAWGKVYAAYDPELDRKVAIKVLWRRNLGPGATERVARLYREARALAQVTHPNVVSVYDVGTYAPVGQDSEDGLFIVMELVEGTQLDRWLGTGHHHWREVLRVVCEAGQGLAAAHRAGVVHRDFKPANVIIGDDGRVRVLDFGLALATPDQRVASAQQRLDSEEPDGPLLGTLAYMAPEQRAGLEVDGRADQFAFCVTLYEALYRRLPHSGQSPAELLRNKTEGRLRPRVTTLPVPAALHRILVRGLAPRCDERFPTMEALLATLQRAAGAPRRMIAMAGVGLASVVALGAAVWQPDPDDACAAEGAVISEVWNAGARERIRMAFASTELPYAASVWSAASQTVDRYAETWARERTATCRAASHGGPRAWLDHRDRCLDAALEELRALVDVWGSADAEVIDHAGDAAAGLTRPAACGTFSGPEDVGASIPFAWRRDADRALARASVLARSGKTDDALAIATAIRKDAAAQGSALVEGKAWSWIARLERRRANGTDAEDAYFEAIDRAERVGDDETALRAMVGLVGVVGYANSRPAEGERLSRIARARLARSGEPDQLRAEFAHELAQLRLRQGRLKEAAERAREAILVGEQVLGTDHPMVFGAKNTLGVALYEAADYGAAVHQFDHCVAWIESRLGPGHPRTFKPRLNAAASRLESGKFVEAEATLLDMLERFGPGAHADLRRAHILHNLAVARLWRGRAGEALGNIDSALLAYRGAHGDTHTSVAAATRERGKILAALRDHGGALEELGRARAIYARVHGPDHRSQLLPLVEEIRIRIALGEHGEVERLAQEIEQIAGIDHDSWTPSDRLAAALGRALAEAFFGHHGAVARLLEPELEARATTGHTGWHTAEPRFVLAKSIAGTAPARALALARDALTDLDAVNYDPRARAEIRAWLDAQGAPSP